MVSELALRLFRLSKIVVFGALAFLNVESAVGRHESASSIAPAFLLSPDRPEKGCNGPIENNSLICFKVVGSALRQLVGGIQHGRLRGGHGTDLVCKG